jgi:hypothetical protein
MAGKSFLGDAAGQKKNSGVPGAADSAVARSTRHALRGINEFSSRDNSGLKALPLHVRSRTNRRRNLNAERAAETALVWLWMTIGVKIQNELNPESSTSISQKLLMAMIA